MRKQDHVQAPLRVEWCPQGNPAVWWVRLLELHVLIYYHGGDSPYLVVY